LSGIFCFSAMGFAEPELDELRRKRNGRTTAVRAL